MSTKGADDLDRRNNESLNIYAPRGRDRTCVYFDRNRAYLKIILHTRRARRALQKGRYVNDFKCIYILLVHEPRKVLR